MAQLLGQESSIDAACWTLNVIQIKGSDSPFDVLLDLRMLLGKLAPISVPPGGLEAASTAHKVGGTSPGVKGQDSLMPPLLTRIKAASPRMNSAGE